MTARDMLAVILGSVLGAVWAVTMVALVVRGQVPSAGDWAWLPAGVAALMEALQTPVYAGKHRRSANA